MSRNNKVIVADIGGSHITAACIDLNTKKIEENSVARIAVSHKAEKNEVVSAWADCLQKTNFLSKNTPICLAIPGPFDYQEGICFIRDQAKYPGLYGANVKILLAEKLGCSTADIFMENDAACFIAGEVFGGSMQEFDAAIGITLGTGLGSAVFKNQQGKDAALWNMPFKNGIAEDYISSRWFVKKYGEMTGQDIGGVRDLIDTAKDRDLVRMIFEEFSDNLALFLIEFLKRENPQAIVLGGNISKAFSFFGARLKAEIQKHSPGIVVRVSELGEDAALYGAAGAWQNSLQEN